MRKLKCSVCREWFEAKGTPFCSDLCFGKAKERSNGVGRVFDEIRKKEELEKEERLRKKRVWKFAAFKKKELKKQAKEKKQKLKVKAPILAPKKVNRPFPKHTFFDSIEWQQLRYKVLKEYGRQCMCCKTRNGEMHVDHIKPRSKHPNLELDFNNLQVLCRACNMGKGNSDEVDYR